MEISFYKVFLGTRDYVLINGFHQPLPSEDRIEDFARQICHRHTGVGGMGLLILEPDSEHSAALRFLAPEGPESAPSSAVLMCASRYVFDYGLAQKEEIVLQTSAGPSTLQCIDSRHFSLLVGTPTSDGIRPIVPGQAVDYQVQIKTGGRTVSCTPVQFTNPLAAIYMTERQEQVHDPLEMKDGIYLPVYYRVFSSEEIELPRLSSDEIDSIEAAAAAAVAAVSNGFCERDAVVLQPDGGQFFFEWNERSNSVFITATPRYAFAGSFAFEEEEYGPAD
ncbi:MAG: hypothetical protein ACP5IA_04885 [Sediminispirochaetaceae bacterium]